MSNKIKLYFLGNSASTPTKERNLSSLLLNYDGDSYLFDCPENVQQRILKSKQSILKINNIFITHMHGDHYYGLFGLLSTMDLNNRVDPLNIFVPFGYSSFLKKSINLLNNKLNFKININQVRSNFKYKYKYKDLIIESIKLDHSILTYGYTFKIKDKIGKFNRNKAIKLGVPIGPLFSKLQSGKFITINKKVIKPKDVIDFRYKKKGAKLAYLLDTAVLKKIPKKLKDVDYLVHECTFLDKHKLKANKVKHTVALDLSKFAKKLKPKTLFVTHISTRYKDFKDLKKELNKYFSKNVIVKNLDYFELEDFF